VFAIAAAPDLPRAWVSGSQVDLSLPAFQWDTLHYHGLGGEAVVRGSYLYVPVSFLAAAFAATLVTADAGASATLTLQDGRRLQFARGNIGCVLDGRITSMLGEVVERGGELCVSLEWFAAHVMDLRVTRHSDVVYVTDHHAQLSGNLALLLRDLLK
jgi:hypothetical protein